MELTLRERILKADDLPRKAIKIPEWGDLTVYVRTLTAGERDRFEGQQNARPFTDVRARLASMALVDESGTQLFSEEDVAALTAKSSKALDRIFAAAVRLNGISKADIDELKKA